MADRRLLLAAAGGALVAGALVAARIVRARSVAPAATGDTLPSHIVLPDPPSAELEAAIEQGRAAATEPDAAVAPA